MRTSRFAVSALLLIAVALSGASITWAVSRSHSGGGMHGRSAWMMTGYAPGGKQSVSNLAEAKARAGRFAERLNLRVDEVLQFGRNYYAKLVDRAGAGATEALVDPKSGVVSLEYGPAMMWNTRYGMASGRWSDVHGRGMMGRYGGTMMSGGGMMGTDTTTTPPPTSVSLDEARTLAQDWLDANQRGVQVESGGDAFPGYFTFETLRDGHIEGMISVRQSTGAVWPHWWHGAFVAEA